MRTRQLTREVFKDLKGECDHAFGRLYSAYFGMVQRFVTNNSGTRDDAEDIFQDTMLVLVQKLRRDDFQLTACIKTYIMAIAKNLWLKKLRNAYREIEFTDLHGERFHEEIELAIAEEKSYWEKLQNYMEHITEHCRGLIQDIFFQQKAIEQIQKEYGYSTRHNAQNQKHKCVEQIRRVKAAAELRRN